MPRLFGAVVVVFALTLIAGGGSSHPELATIAIRIAAIAVIVTTLVGPASPAGDKSGLRGIWCLSLLAVTIVALQLVPIPYAWWTALPGRSFYAFPGVVDLTPFRPITLTPDLTLRFLAGLAVPTAAAVISMRYSNQWTLIAGGFLCLGAISAIVALLQIAPGGDALQWHGAVDEPTASGLFANRNHQAVFLSCILLLAVAWLYGPGRDIVKVVPGARLGIAIAGVGVLASVAVAAGSRLGVPIALGAMVYAIALIRISTRGRRDSGLSQTSWRYLLAGATLSAAAIAVFAALPNSGVSRLLSEGIADRSRQDWFPVLLDMARTFFPVGSGYGSFDSVYRNFEPDALLRREYLNQAHNDPLQLVIEGGLPALVALFVGSVVWLRWAATLLRAKGTSADLVVGRACIAITAICAVSSLFDYPLRTPLLASLFVVALVWMRHAARQVAPLPGKERPVSSDASKSRTGIGAHSS